MACNCNYSCASSSSMYAMMSMAAVDARQQKINDIMHQMNTKGVVFSIRRKEPEPPKEDKRVIKFI